MDNCTECWTESNIAEGLDDPTLWSGAKAYLSEDQDGKYLKEVAPGIIGRSLDTPFELFPANCDPDTSTCHCKIQCKEGYFYAKNKDKETKGDRNIAVAEKTPDGNNWNGYCHECGSNCKTCILSKLKCSSCWTESDFMGRGEIADWFGGDMY